MKPEQIPLAAYIAHRVARWREAHPGSTQQSIAAEVGVNQGALSRYLAGKVAPDGDALAKVARFLGTEPEALRRDALTWWADEGRRSNADLALVQHADRDGLAAFVVHRVDQWVAKSPADRTVSSFATLARVPKSAFSHYRRNSTSPDPVTLRRIAIALGTTPEQLVGDAIAWWEENRARVEAGGNPLPARAIATVGGVSDERWAEIRQSAWDAAAAIPEWMRDEFLERARRAELLVIEGGPPDGQDIADVAEALYRVYDRSRGSVGR